MNVKYCGKMESFQAGNKAPLAGLEDPESLSPFVELQEL